MVKKFEIIHRKDRKSSTNIEIFSESKDGARMARISEFCIKMLPSLLFL